MTSPILKVYSFPRSGTHWFMSLLKARFYASVETGGTMEDFEKHRDFRNWTGPSKDAPWAALLGGHWYHPTRAPSFEKPIYLIRDGLDTIYSLWRFARSRWKIELSPGEYLRNPQPALGGDVNPVQAGLSIAVHWHWSTKLWWASDVPMVRYEELLRDSDRILDWVGDHYGLKDDRTSQDKKTPVGYFPSAEPGKGKGRRAFNPKDIQYFVVEAKEEADRLLAKDAWYRARFP